MQSQHEILMQDLEFRREFVIERFVGECTEVISRIMHEKGISKSVLSRRLGKSRAWVTQLLSGSRNMTARTLAEVAFALDVELRLQSSLHAANLDRGEWHELGSSTMERGRGGSKPRVIEFR
ncbi:MAG: helix-turn-helix transcriptional regulator, partial [Bryobacterales bacterium]|nr:helix-turn-helix transcriptional regulator [Bryobacterales bacterium]